ncbi:MAG: ParB/RepB/Spo0J family partition protein [Spirochaetales bacterium]|nr:ParB/RepB/Spo0J family partition protein [Spirochaetales bacterium]
MQLKIDDVIVKKRIRKDLGDLTQLTESIRKHGLMNPIVVNTKNELIAGERRLESVKRLGWQTIPAHVISDVQELQKIEMELDENIHRRNLSADELADAFALIDRLKNPRFFRKIWRAIVAFFKRLFGRS